MSDDEDDGEKVQQPADAGGGAALESNKTASGPNRPAQASRRPGAKMSFDLEEVQEQNLTGLLFYLLN